MRRKIAFGIYFVGLAWIGLILLHIPHGFRLFPLFGPGNAPVDALIIFWVVTTLSAWIGDFHFYD